MIKPTSKLNDSIIMGEAICNAISILQIQNDELPQELQSIPCVDGTPQIDPDSEAGKMSILVISIFRSLMTITGHDEKATVEFLRSKNKGLSFHRSIDLISSLDGLKEVDSYCDYFLRK